MAFNVSSLTDYVIEKPEQLIWEKIYSTGPTASLMQKQTGVKSAEKINILSTEGVWQAQGCSFNASGSTNFTQAELNIGKVKIDMSFCERDLEPKYTQGLLANGGNYDHLSLAKEITDLVLANANKRLTTAIWQGDTTSVSVYLNKFDGLQKQINAATGKTTISGTAWSSANSRTVIQALNASVVANTDVYSGEPTIKYFMHPATAYAYRQKLITDNLFHIDGNNPKQKLYAEGTGIEIVEDFGVTPNYIYAVEPENMFMGVDAENELDKIELWFSKDDQNIKLHTEFKVCTNVAFGSRCWQYLGV